jgi:hypothetical protein
MNQKMKIRSIKGLPTGTPIPMKQHNGNVGRKVEEMYKDRGFNTSKGTVDLPDYGIEIKTRKNSTTASNTIGSMTIQDIIDTPYKKTTIYQKLQKQQRIKYDDAIDIYGHSTVTSDKTYDFSDPYIQDKLEKDYEILRSKIISGCRNKEIKASGWAWLDGYSCTGSYRFRIPHNTMIDMETISSTAKSFNRHFDQ